MTKRQTNAFSITSRAKVSLWGRHVGNVTQYTSGRIGFSYAADYLKDGVALSPIHLPLDSSTFEFSGLVGFEAFMGLPGVFADSLPDKFGNLIIKNYFDAKGQPDKALSPVQKLLYVGSRAMGGLEYAPHLQRKTPEDELALEMSALVTSARKLIEGDTSEAINEIMRVGGSAGGARAKALILRNRVLNRVKSGFAVPQKNDEHWLIKFDGVDSANRPDLNIRPYNRIEYTYALMTVELNIDMAPADFIEEENGLFHVMFKRFDREGSEKIHMHSLGGMTHVDFHRPQSFSYENWFRLILQLGLGYQTLEQAYRRMIFNIVGRNQDDHVKNISFIMNKTEKTWQLSPAYDLTYAYGSGFTVQHQMTLKGRADNFERNLLIEVGQEFDIKNPESIIDATVETFSHWPELARKYGVPEKNVLSVNAAHRLYLSN
jgi:serine/threonine-protein kinase HipA